MLLVFPAVWVAVGFIPVKTQSDCQHIYTAVEPLEATRGLVVIDSGRKLVCIKCFQQIEQKVKEPPPIDWKLLFGPATLPTSLNVVLLDSMTHRLIMK